MAHVLLHSIASNVVPIEMNVNCLFRGVSYLMHNTGDIRLHIVTKIDNEREYHKDFTVDLLMVNRLKVTKFCSLGISNMAKVLN